ncbi:MAG: zf-HC2 domain-containing protein [Acetobacteraceae bacterium]|nr:zf-HC2 domain-containing protein [Acetobacteraceae bacterium]
MSAQADNELTREERYLAEEHLRGCGRCRASLLEERELKAQIQLNAGITKAPADVRLRIRAALGEALEPARQPRDFATRAGGFIRRSAEVRPNSKPSLRRAAACSFGEPAHDSASSRQWLWIQVERMRRLAPIGFVVIVLAATTVLFRFSSRNLSGSDSADYSRSIRAFDFAIDRFNQLSQEFTPNVPPEAYKNDSASYFAWVVESNPLRHVSAELPDISASYEKVQMLPEFCDFALAGYELAGGRIDRMPDGEPVTYTLYRNQTDSLLSIGLRKQVSAPHGGYWFGAHALYSYRGYGICLTIYPVGHFVSIIVTRRPMVELLRSVALSDAAVWNH